VTFKQKLELFLPIYLDKITIMHRCVHLTDVLHPTTRHIAYMNTGTLLPIKIMS